MSDPDNRERSAELAWALMLVIEAHMAEAHRKPEVIHADQRIIDAAVAVAVAATKIEQTIYTRGEIRARSDLFKAAKDLRAALRKGRHHD